MTENLNFEDYLKKEDDKIEEKNETSLHEYEKS